MIAQVASAKPEVDDGDACSVGVERRGLLRAPAPSARSCASSWKPKPTNERKAA